MMASSWMQSGGRFLTACAPAIALAHHAIAHRAIRLVRRFQLTQNQRGEHGLGYLQRLATILRSHRPTKTSNNLSNTENSSSHKMLDFE